MKPPHPKYKIKEGDTITNITKLFDVEEDVWLRYHNNMCRLNDIIRDKLPKHLKEIYLLPELWQQEISLNYTSEKPEEANRKTSERVQNKDSEQKLLTNWAIYPRPNSLNHSYWFRYIIEDEKDKTEIRYKILVRYIRQETEETSLYLINRISDVYINDELPNLCLDELAYETGKVFYPIIVEVDKRAQWIALRNYEQIKGNWINTIRPYVTLRYGGEVGKQYLKKMDEVINNKDKTEEILKNDLFFKLYFGTFYHSYSPQFEIDKILESPTGTDFPAFFKTKCRLNRTLTDKGYKEIRQIGIGLINNVPDERNEFIEDEQASYSARILLETKTNCVQEIQAEWNIKNTGQRTKLILYPLREQYKEKIDIKIDKVNSNKSLFSRLFG